MEWAVLLVLAVVGLAFWAARPGTVFVVRIDRSQPRATRGVVTPAFLNEIDELCREFGVAHGEIRGIHRDRRIALEFSRHIPAGFQQRLRNWWTISGWIRK